MWPSSTRAFDSNVPRTSWSFNELLLLSAQAVSLLKATKPPSLSGTTTGRFTRSCELTAQGAARSNASKPMVKARALLLIVKAPLDDRQLDLIGRLKASEIHR